MNVDGIFYDLAKALDCVIHEIYSNWESMKHGVPQG
jgi:hypothetical protein